MFDVGFLVVTIFEHARSVPWLLMGRLGSCMGLNLVPTRPGSIGRPKLPCTKLKMIAIGAMFSFAHLL